MTTSGNTPWLLAVPLACLPALCMLVVGLLSSPAPVVDAQAAYNVADVER